MPAWVHINSLHFEWVFEPVLRKLLAKVGQVLPIESGNQRKRGNSLFISGFLTHVYGSWSVGKWEKEEASVDKF